MTLNLRGELTSPGDLEADITLDAGELVAGRRATLRFRVTAREPVRIRGAHASFVVFEETQAVYTTTQTSGSPPRTTTVTHTATERTMRVEKHKTFRGRPRAGFFRNLADAVRTSIGAGAHDTLPRGSHEVLLEVDLPVDLAGTLSAKKARVACEAEIHLDIPAGRDFRRTVSFSVLEAAADGDVVPEPLSIRYPEDAAQGLFDALFGPDVSVRVVLPSTVVQRGAVLAGELEVLFAGKPATVEAIECRLIRRETSTAEGHEDHHAETLVTERFPQRQGTAHYLVAPFELRLPEAMIPTCRGVKFTIENELSISLDVPWAKDPTIRIPITAV